MDKNLAPKKELDELTARVDHFSTIEHIDTLVNIFIPKINKFSVHLDKFLSDNIDMREGIIRFDNDLSLKANKA